MEDFDIPQNKLADSAERALKEATAAPQRAEPLSFDNPERHIEHLEQELSSSREYLQSIIEELRSTNEEAQSANEELQSINEELQSSNEALNNSPPRIILATEPALLVFVTAALLPDAPAS